MLEKLNRFLCWDAAPSGNSELSAVQHSAVVFLKEDIVGKCEVLRCYASLLLKVRKGACALAHFHHSSTTQMGVSCTGARIPTEALNSFLFEKRVVLRKNAEQDCFVVGEIVFE